MPIRLLGAEIEYPRLFCFFPKEDIPQVELPGFSFTTPAVRFEHFRGTGFELFCDARANRSLAVAAVSEGLRRVSVDKNITCNVLDGHLQDPLTLSVVILQFSA